MPYNPMLAQAFRSAFPTKDLQCSSNAGAIIEDFQLPEFDLASSPASMEIYLRPKASWHRMLTQEPPVFTVGRLSNEMGPTCYKWNSGLIAICLGGAEPVSTPLDIEGPSKYLSTKEINDDWKVMAAKFDLVLVRSFVSTCTDPESDDPDYVKSTVEAVWEKICETYCNLRLTVTELKMEDYNEGSAWWQ